MKINNSNKGFIVQGVIALVALVLIGGGAYYAGTKKIEVVENSHIITSISNWKTYSSNKYGFEFKYPSDWSITEEASEGEIVVATPTNNSVNYSIDNFFIGVLASPQSDRSAPKFICKDFSWKKESSTSPRWSMFKCLERNLYINLTATNEEMKMTLEKILSTFKFTSPNLAAHECQMNSHWDVKVDGCVMDPGKGIPSTDNLNSSIKPYITVLSPNGGEIYKAGNTMKINWIATNTENIAISVNTPDGFLAPYGTSGAIIGALIPNNGSYLWTIPQAFPAGTYRISATIPYNSATKLSGKDLSDSTFTIIK